MKFSKIFVFSLIASAAINLFAEVKLPRIFSDEMILQSQKPVKIWGTAEAGADVKATFAGQSKTVTAGADGKWSLAFEPLEAAPNPRDMEICENGKLAKTIKNILVGEVWILGGQSNMEMAFSWRNLLPEGNKLVRYFKNSEATISVNPSVDTPISSAWVKAEGDNLRDFSMIGYLFAQKLAGDLQIPVGLVFAARGGTGMETWIPMSEMDNLPILKAKKDEFYKKLPDWKNGGYKKAYAAHKQKVDDFKAKIEKAKSEGKTPPQMPWLLEKWPSKITPIDPWHSPSLHWNGKVAPLAGFTARGFLWYQGESNQNDSIKDFSAQFQTLVAAWRKAWGDSSMPWLAVELASYKHGNDWGKVRAAQLDGVMKTPLSFLASSVDTGEADDIHPADKQAISDRLERIAMRRIYGAQDIADKSPLFASAQFRKGGALVKFDTFSQKLQGRGEPRGFELKIDGKWVAGKPAIKSKSSVWVSAADSQATPEGVRYLYKSWTKSDVWLYTADGLPAYGFSNEIK